MLLGLDGEWLLLLLLGWWLVQVHVGYGLVLVIHLGVETLNHKDELGYNWIDCMISLIKEECHITINLAINIIQFLDTLHQLILILHTTHIK